MERFKCEIDGILKKPYASIEQGNEVQTGKYKGKNYTHCWPLVLGAAKRAILRNLPEHLISHRRVIVAAFKHLKYDRNNQLPEDLLTRLDKVFKKVTSEDKEVILTHLVAESKKLNASLPNREYATVAASAVQNPINSGIGLVFETLKDDEL